MTFIAFSVNDSDSDFDYHLTKAVTQLKDKLKIGMTYDAIQKKIAKAMVKIAAEKTDVTYVSLILHLQFLDSPVLLETYNDPLTGVLLNLGTHEITEF